MNETATGTVDREAAAKRLALELVSHAATARTHSMSIEALLLAFGTMAVAHPCCRDSSVANLRKLARRLEGAPARPLGMADLGGALDAVPEFGREDAIASFNLLKKLGEVINAEGVSPSVGLNAMLSLYVAAVSQYGRKAEAVPFLQELAQQWQGQDVQVRPAGTPVH